MKLRIARKVLKNASDFANYRGITFDRAMQRVDYPTYQYYLRRLMRNVELYKETYGKGNQNVE